VGSHKSFPDTFPNGCGYASLGHFFDDTGERRFAKMLLRLRLIMVYLVKLARNITVCYPKQHMFQATK
jgi:hypothetical protein